MHNNTPVSHPEAKPPIESSTSRRNKTSRIKIALLIIAIVILICIIAAVAYVINKKTEDKATISNPAVVEMEKNIPDLKKAVDDRPKDAVAKYDLGSAYYATKKLSNAAKQFEEAVKIDNKNYIYYNSLGNTYRDQKKYQQAIEQYQKSIDNNPNSLNAYSNKANVQVVHMSDTDGAIKTYDAAIKANDQSSAMMLLKAGTLEQATRRDEAKKTYQMIIDKEPGNKAARAGLDRTNK